MNDTIYTIYKILCKVNNKVYIGYTKKKVAQRLEEHKRTARLKKQKYKLQKAIRKYGPENFLIYELYQSKDIKHIRKMEDVFITEYNSIEYGYNIAKGGQGGTLNNAGTFTAYDPESNTFVKVKKDDNRFLEGKINGATKGQVTVKDEHGNVFNVRLDDERYLNGEYKFVCSDREVSDDTRKKIAKSQKQRLSIKNVHNGIINIYHPVYGFKKVQPENLDYFLENGWIKKHPSEGTVIVNKDGVNTRIPKERLSEMLEQGWKEGGKSMLSFTDGKTTTKVHSEDVEKIQELTTKGFWRGATRRPSPK
jgi:group I intron endonuclease